MASSCLHTGVAVSWDVVSWAVVSWDVVSSWAVVTWDVVSSWAVVGSCNIPCLPVGSNLVYVVFARVHRYPHPLLRGLMVQCCAPNFWIASRVHMGTGVCFVSHALRGALVDIVLGVVSVGPTIFSGFVAPYIVREIPAVESAGAVGAPCWFVSSPVFAGITAAFAALVFVSDVILVLLWGLLLPLMPRLCCAYHQLLLHLAHRHLLLLNLGLLVADCLLGARVSVCKFFDERLVLRVARWLVLNLVSGVASVMLAVAHLSHDCADFPFEACFHYPPYP